MKSLEEHNKESLELFSILNTFPRPNGISCPKCGAEMFDSDNMVLTSYPPKKNVRCQCGHKDFAFI